MERFVFVGDVILRESSLALSHAASGVPGKQARKVLFGSTTMQKQSLSTFTIAPARSTTLRTGVHLLPMIIGLVTTAPSQWKKFKICGPAHAGEQIFVAAGKADDLVRKHRPDDDDLVVIEQHVVDLHRHVHREQAVGQFADFIGGERADLFQRRGIVPLVIEEFYLAVGFLPFLLRNFQPLANGRLVHRLMRAQGDEHVEGLLGFRALFEKNPRGTSHRRGARAIRHDEQHPFAAIILRRTGPRYKLGHFGWRYAHAWVRFLRGLPADKRPQKYFGSSGELLLGKKKVGGLTSSKTRDGRWRGKGKVECPNFKGMDGVDNELKEKEEGKGNLIS